MHNGQYRLSYIDKTNNPISRNSQHSATAYNARHCLKRRGLQNLRGHSVILIKCNYKWSTPMPHDKYIHFSHITQNCSIFNKGLCNLYHTDLWYLVSRPVTVQSLRHQGIITSLSSFHSHRKHWNRPKSEAMLTISFSELPFMWMNM